MVVFSVYILHAIGYQSALKLSSFTATFVAVAVGLCIEGWCFLCIYLFETSLLVMHHVSHRLHLVSIIFGPFYVYSFILYAWRVHTWAQITWQNAKTSWLSTFGFVCRNAYTLSVWSSTKHSKTHKERENSKREREREREETIESIEMQNQQNCEWLMVTVPGHDDRFLKPQ